VRGEIPSLNGIRGVAVMLVFLSHAGLDRIVPGGFGVTIFFFLSGYLITTLLRTEFEQTGHIHLRNFYLRRLLRIFPPMYLVLSAALVMTFVHDRPVSGPMVLAQYLHLTNYVSIFGDADQLVPDTGIFWSLAVEEHYYLIFPLALLALFRRMPRERVALLLALTCGIVLLWRFVLVKFGASSEYTYRATDARIDSILYGAILALYCNPLTDSFSKPRVLAALVVGGALLLGSLAYRDPVFRETLRYSVQGVGLLPIFYCAVRFPRWPLFAWLNTRMVRGLGIISYTFYLTHLLFLSITRGWMSPLADAVLAAALTVAFSSTSYVLMERPLGKLRRSLHQTREIPHASHSSARPVPT
jgi:peptidoglycan/LPS O-acetylase OafA/YrhL